MDHKTLRSYAILHYLLSIIVGFFLGIMYAGWIEAGKGQMLAAGAIVLGYGVMGSVMGLVIAILFIRWSNRQTILRGNILLTIMVTGFLAYYMGKYQRKSIAESTGLPPETQLPDKKISSPAKKPTTGVKSADIFTTVEAEDSENNQPDEPSMLPVYEIGLGLFAPEILHGQPLYFYRQPIIQWPPLATNIVDSITFRTDENNNLSIASAPPRFLPAHLKVDYGIFFMKIKTVYQHSLEVEVNKESGLTALVSKEPGKVVYWPEFILSVVSIELKDDRLQKIRNKPLDYSEVIRMKYEFLKPVAVRGDWVKVHLLNIERKKIGSGWTKWREYGQLLIHYSLLS